MWNTYIKCISPINNLTSYCIYLNNIIFKIFKSLCFWPKADAIKFITRTSLYIATCLYLSHGISHPDRYYMRDENLCGRPTAYHIDSNKKLTPKSHQKRCANVCVYIRGFYLATFSLLDNVFCRIYVRWNTGGLGMNEKRSNEPSQNQL